MEKPTKTKLPTRRSSKLFPPCPVTFPCRVRLHVPPASCHMSPPCPVTSHPRVLSHVSHVSCHMSSRVLSHDFTASCHMFTPRPVTCTPGVLSHVPSASCHRSNSRRVKVPPASCHMSPPLPVTCPPPRSVTGSPSVPWRPLGNSSPFLKPPSLGPCPDDRAQKSMQDSLNESPGPNRTLFFKNTFRVLSISTRPVGLQNSVFRMLRIYLSKRCTACFFL